MQIVQAATDRQLEAVRGLMRSFVEWHYERHHEYRDLIDSHFDTASFEAELEALPGDFAPPRGALLVAELGDQVAGCVALCDLGDGACEMKRMFVDPRYHGRGVGLALGHAVVTEARRIGHDRMLLDTGPKQVEAQGLYKRLGFRRIPPYSDLDEAMCRWLVFMELDLSH